MAASLIEFIKVKIQTAFEDAQKNGSIPKDVLCPNSIRLGPPKSKRFGAFSTNFLVPLSRKYIMERNIEQCIDADHSMAEAWARSLSLLMAKFSYYDEKQESGIALYCENRSKGFLNFFFVNAMEATKILHPMDSVMTDIPSRSIQLKVIGVVKSCFRIKYGTPRQGGLVPSSCGVVELFKEYQADCLMGLSDFSHVWILFLFHLQDPHFQKSKVQPVKLSGAKTGVFATRSPHRPSPVGLSVAKIDRIEGHKIFVRGIDIVDGSPLIDIKPYHIVDTFPTLDKNCTYPNWTHHSLSNSQLLQVTYSESCIPKFYDHLNNLRKNCAYNKNDTEPPFYFLEAFDETETTNKALLRGEEGGIYPFRFFASVKSFFGAVEECITVDPRSLEQAHYKQCGESFQYYVDDFEILFRIVGMEAKILQIDFCGNEMIETLL
ncbi:putative S-adenosylmethionine-dependent [Cardiosporidium cionae]|uniref:S-adenosylmethionine-dependent n=1 Tax=Cardiosporidium cionae TaxID=476202 RepID=A0ABQ7JEH7_9APIC|nr:putative S-adenosylmethionine-dependent [Cardiosporidium cionae]|eukprot:KAF8822055.1 putative S-adenosylmethionine-dependent [Cardiosporidium cionae]